MSETPLTEGTTSTPRKRHIVAAAALYFAAVFAVGVVLGPLRVLWLEPLVGPTIAVLCESPLLLIVMAIAGRYVPRLMGVDGNRFALLGVGVLALLFQQIADLSVGFGLRGMTLNEQLAIFRTPPGWIYIFDLYAFALAPLLMAPRRQQ